MRWKTRHPELIARMPLAERAALLKALIVHVASWRGSEQFIRSVIDPAAALHNEHWRREVCRHLGYGFVDPDDGVACAADRATMWATGAIGAEGSMTFDVPIPTVFGGNPDLREVRGLSLGFRRRDLDISSIERSNSLQADALEIAASTRRRDNPPTPNRRAGQSCIGDGVTRGLVPSAARFLSRFSASVIRVRRLMRPYRLA